MGRIIYENRLSNHFSKNQNEGNESQAIMNQNQFDSQRIVVLHGDVNEHTISLVVGQMLYLASVNHKPIHLVVSTYGGSVDEMFTLYDTIKFLPCPVQTIALGKVMSAGVLLLASGEKGKRLIGRSARIMMHPVSGGSVGNIFEVHHELTEHNRLHNLMIDALARESKMPRENILEIMKTGHDMYYTADDAIKFGIVDKIVGDDRK